MEHIPYNSRSEIHKYPFGATELYDWIYLKVVMPRSLMCTAVRIIFHKDGHSLDSINMNWVGMEGDSEEWWGAEVRVPETGLFFYHFEFDTAFGTNKIMHNGNCCGIINGGTLEWQFSVYEKGFTTPDWLKGGLIYQIFPDRFCASGKAKKNILDDRILRKDWGAEPKWRPENGKVLNNDFFGGDLAGITSKIPYLKELGVSCIYLNPIFESQSNHRYDTSDYSKIDPVLGSEKDFEILCQEAEENGISIILDGVFSHTGADSIYFNKNERYDSKGAYQTKTSDYFNWYKFEKWPDKYSAWWDFPTLPEVDEENDDYIEFIAGKKGILRKWLKAGAKGWRLDVADELPDKFLDATRRAIKEENPDAILLGEVWEDASNKCSYGQRRRYLRGEQLDSVMNYPFAEAIIDFVRTGKAEGFSNKIFIILENYPKCVVDVLMNHIGTHDTMRAITALVGESCEHRDREWQSKKQLTNEQIRDGVQLLKLASLIQYTLPGVPSLYYGDEAGMQGYKDPFNRFCYPWGNENSELLEWYKMLGQIRKNTACLKDGRFYMVSEALSCICYVRANETDKLMVIINRNNHDIDYTIPADWASSVAVMGEKYGMNVAIGANSAAVLKIEV